MNAAVNMGHVLLVDDEPGIISSLRTALTAAGHSVSIARNGTEAIALVGRDEADVMLLDLGLPDMDGKDVILAVRDQTAMPIIVLSARHQEHEKIASLDCGADDYVDKPFALGELLARIRAAVRTRGRSRVAAKPAEFRGGGLHIDFGLRKVSLDGEPVHCSPKEYALLVALAENAGQVVTHRRLLAAGWGRADTDPQYLRTYMGMLRQKLIGDTGRADLIHNEPGVGYRLVLAD